MQNEYQSYQCQICQRYLIFQENIFEPIDPIYLTTFAKQSQQFDQNEQQNIHLSFSEQLFEEFRKNSPMMKDPELFNFEVIETVDLSPHNSYSPNAFRNSQKMKDKSFSKQQTSIYGLSSSPQPISSLSQTSKKGSRTKSKRKLKLDTQHFSLSESHFSSSLATPNSGSKSFRDEFNELNGMFDLPKYRKTLVEPVEMICKKIGVDFPLCRNCYHKVESLYSDEMTSYSMYSRDQQIFFLHESKEDEQMKQIEEEIEKEQQMIETLTKEVNELEMKYKKFYEQSLIVKQLKEISFDHSSKYYQQCNKFTQISMQSIDDFYAMRHSQMRETQFLKYNNKLFELIFTLDFDVDEIVINNIKLVESIKTKNQQKFIIIVSYILKMIRICEFLLKLKPIRIPEISVKKPNIIFAFLLKSLDRLVKYILLSSSTFVIPYHIDINIKRIQNVQFVPINLKDDLDTFVIAMKFYLSNLKYVTTYAITTENV